MPFVLELSLQDVSALYGQIRVFARKGLDACHFIRTQGRFATLSPFLSGLIDLIDVGDLRVRLRVGFGGQIVAHQMRLEIPFLSKRAAWRREMYATMPRFIISSAISRPVHWLMG